MKLMRKPLLVVLSVLMALLVGCSKPQQFGGLPRDRDKVFTGIASLSPSTTELLAILQVPLMGRSKSDNFPSYVSTVPVIGDLKPNYEMIAKMGKPLIFLDKDLYGDAEIAKLKETGATIEPMSATTLEEFYKELYKIGNLCGKESPANEMVIKIKKQEMIVRGDPIGGDKSTAIIVPGPGGHHMVAGANSFIGNCVKLMGLKVVGPDSKKWEMANVEFLLAQNPDYLLVSGDVKNLLADPRLANMKAVRSKAYFTLPEDIVLRKASRVEDLLRDAHKGYMILEGRK